MIGAGAVGCEFADIFNAFGTKVTLIEALPRILPLEDAESSDALAKSYKKRGITVLAGAKVTKATVAAGQGDARRVEAGGKTETVEVEKVLMAAGRAVNTEGMGFQEAGVQLTDRGFVQGRPGDARDHRARRLLHRRRGRPPDAGAQGQPGGRERGRADRRPAPARRSSTTTCRA